MRGTENRGFPFTPHGAPPLLWNFASNERKKLKHILSGSDVPFSLSSEILFQSLRMFDEPKKKKNGGNGDDDDQKTQEDKGGAEAGKYYQDTRIGEGSDPAEANIT